MNHMIQGEDSHDYLIWRAASGRSVEILDIQVNSDRRKGVGRSLVARLIDTLPKGTGTPGGVTMLWAMTRLSNTLAQQFWEGCNFYLLGRLHRFYHDGPKATEWESALVYGMDL